MNLLQEICRTCKSEFHLTYLKPLFEEQSSLKIKPIDFVNKYFDEVHQVLEKDGLPQKICVNCLQKFILLNEFVQSCQHNQTILKELLLTKNKSTKNIKVETNLDTDNARSNQNANNESDQNHSEFLESTDNMIFESDDFKSSSSSEESEEFDFTNDTKYQQDVPLVYNFKCKFCIGNIKVFSSKKDYELHLCLEHKEVFKDLGIMKKNTNAVCEVCGLKMKAILLKDHVQAVHKNIMSYKCDYCEEAFPYKTNLTFHIKCAHKLEYLKIEKKKNQLTYECEDCKQIFKTLIALKTHITKRHGSDNPRNANPRHKPFPCDQCDRVYYRSDHLKQHVQRIHLKSNPYKCDQCSKSFTLPYQLKHHFRINHDVYQDVECDICEKVFKGKYNIMHQLNLHKKEEHSDTPHFECILCNVKFFKKYDLKKHGRLHDEEVKKKLQQKQ